MGRVFESPQAHQYKVIPAKTQVILSNWLPRAFPKQLFFALGKRAEFSLRGPWSGTDETASEQEVFVPFTGLVIMV